MGKNVFFNTGKVVVGIDNDDAEKIMKLSSSLSEDHPAADFINGCIAVWNRHLRNTDSCKAEYFAEFVEEFPSFGSVIRPFPCSKESALYLCTEDADALFASAGLDAFLADIRKYNHLV